MKVEIYRDENATELQLWNDGAITLTENTSIHSQYQLDDDDIYNLIKDLKALVTRRKLNNEWTLGTLGDSFNKPTERKN